MRFCVWKWTPWASTRPGPRLPGLGKNRGQPAMKCCLIAPAVGLAPLQAPVDARGHTCRVEPLLAPVVAAGTFLRDAAFFTQRDRTVGTRPETFAAADALAVVMTDRAVGLFIERAIRACGDTHRPLAMVARRGIKARLLFTRERGLPHAAVKLSRSEIIVVLAGQLTGAAAHTAFGIVIKVKFHVLVRL